MAVNQQVRVLKNLPWIGTITWIGSLQIEGIPSVDPPLCVQDNSGKIELNYLNAVTHGQTKTRFNRKGGFHIAKWTSPEDQVEWVFRVDQPGIFRVNVDYSAGREWEGKPYPSTC